jgi:hypothetical protein
LSLRACEIAHGGGSGTNGDNLEPVREGENGGVDGLIANADFAWHLAQFFLDFGVVGGIQ